MKIVNPINDKPFYINVYVGPGADRDTRPVMVTVSAEDVAPVIVSGVYRDLAGLIAQAESAHQQMAVDTPAAPETAAAAAATPAADFYSDDDFDF